MRASSVQEIQGEFQSVRWSNPDGSFLIANLADGTSILGPAKPASFIRGVEYRFSGRWEDNDKFGKQFRFILYTEREPVTADSVMAYLRKNLFGFGSGIGEAKGRILIAKYGPESVLSAIKSDPGSISGIANISYEQAVKASEILIAIEQFESTRVQLAVLFQGRGFTQPCIDRAIEDFGVCAADRIRRDPYTMLVRKYPSAGFLRCDKLYMDLGLPENKLKRQVICFWYLLNQADGSVWINAREAIGELNRLISSRTNPKKAIRLGVRAKWLVTKRDNDGVLWIAERAEAMNERKVLECVKLIMGCDNSLVEI
jgi:exodeoxyribonuclease V alpha subunit